MLIVEYQAMKLDFEQWFKINSNLIDWMMDVVSN